jgi:glutamine amidotransferase
MVIIVDYQLGNLFSVQKAFEAIGAPCKISSDPKDLKTATHIVVPGMGAFPHAMKNLEQSGFKEALVEEVIGNKKPYLGICLGEQFLAQFGFEYEKYPGLGWIEGEVKLLDVEKHNLKVPHIGWNNVTAKKDSKLFAGIKPDTDFYFVHSFGLVCKNPQDVAGTTMYGEELVAAIERDNIYAVQFHPEKSQEAGLQLLENFLKHA